MKIYAILGLLIFTNLSVFAQERFELDEKAEKEINKIISELTLVEKVGQTCQITLDALLARDESGELLEPIQFDPEKFNIALCEYRVGSILNVSSHTLTMDEWNNILPKVNNAFLNKKINVPIIYGIDAIHGVNYTVGATLFPQEIGLAATWNNDLSYEFGEITAYEMRKTGLRWNFSPVLDLARQPLWSRYFETLGEDPYLAGELGESIVMGYQGSKYSYLDDFHVASCLKHFVGYSMPQSGRDRTPAWIPQKFMTELYLPPFKKSIDAGAMTLMINSGDVNGIPGHANKALLTDLLKDEWGFKGFTVSDWEDFIMLQTVHNVAADQREAIAMAINAGVDMSMVPYNPQYKEYCETLLKCVEEGDVSMERLEDAVRRILRVKMAIGLYDKKSYKKTDYPDFASEAFKNSALQSAQESITLLKNEDDLLPLKKSTKVLVAGPTGNNLTFINGAWTHTWQGVDESYNTENCETIYSAIAKKVGAENCQYAQGANLVLKGGWETSTLVDSSDFKSKAANSDVIVLCVGELPSTEKPGDIRSLDLLDAQMDLAKMAYRTGKPVVLVLVEARPRVIHDIVGDANAVFQTYLPGDYGGTALADLMFGDVNPSGKLPYSYPKYPGVVEFYDRPKSVDRSGKSNEFDAFEPEWEFGFGLSYTDFEYSNLSIDKSKMSRTDSIQVTVDVKNVGDREGKEVVQLYISDLKASIVPAGKRLRGYSKIDLKPSETETVAFTIHTDDLQFSDAQGNWILENGEFQVEISGENVNFELN
ncbi:MAG: glycoside hydrolase family 3 N-terminal domain-containing protein [Crocinitomicaceae bacterium]|nr:glycoside hydrolase family 3 N-terminal domain-containing protein [Crocinitomicaceae bacterium]